MTEAELVATALAAGAAAGLTGTAHGTVHDVYIGLKEAVHRRLRGGGARSGDGGSGVCGGYGIRVLDAYETDPDVWRTRLVQALTGSEVERDEEILAAARAVLRAERRPSHLTVGARKSRTDLGGTPVMALVDKPEDFDMASAAEAERVLGAPVRETVRLGHGRMTGVTEGVWRVTAANGRRAVLKLLRPGHDTGAGWWREPEIYTAGLPAPYANAGIRLPQLLARVDRNERSVALWLEDVAGTLARRWTPAQYWAAARRFGLAQGGLGVGHRHGPWGTGSLRAYLDGWAGRVDWALLEDDHAWQHPLVAEHLDATIRDYARRAHGQREEFVGCWEALPHTVCHNDAWSNNLFGVPENPGTSVPVTAIDWSMAGYAPFGSDMGNLALDLLRPAADFAGLDAAVFKGYVTGLHESGSRIEPRLVRLGMVMTAVKWAWLVPDMVARAAGTLGTTAIHGNPPADTHRFFAERAAVLRRLAAWADEARALADACLQGM
ncbi:hypothetical protein AB0D59_27095 [Streptomyces sp. NPDC048417]|uniref:hypothetical protein n=1 Tax=Streptomyces sp. NPDC048417 TaxID=3155387 RepID=UPI003415F80A